MGFGLRWKWWVVEVIIKINWHNVIYISLIEKVNATKSLWFLKSCCNEFFNQVTVFNYDQAKSHIGTGKKSAFYRAIPIETEDGNDGGDIAFNSVEVREEPDMENQYENISAVKELTYEEMMIEERKDTPFDGKKNDIS